MTRHDTIDAVFAVVVRWRRGWRGRRETRYLLSSAANAAALREGLAELEAGVPLEPRELIRRV